MNTFFQALGNTPGFMYIIQNQIIKCLNQIISENKPYNLRLCPFTKLNFKRKI